MTGFERDCLAFVRAEVARGGQALSYGDIARGMGIARSHAFRLVAVLSAQGLLTRRAGVRRSVLPAGMRAVTGLPEAVRGLLAAYAPAAVAAEMARQMIGTQIGGEG